MVIISLPTGIRLKARVSQPQRFVSIRMLFVRESQKGATPEGLTPTSSTGHQQVIKFMNTIISTHLCIV